jgi:hypothetical protein
MFLPPFIQSLAPSIAPPWSSKKATLGCEQAQIAEGTSYGRDRSHLLVLGGAPV